MIVELAIGDAYGAGFEYVSKKVVKEHNNLQQYIQHSRHLSIKPGCYTDDTQMSLAIAELLIVDDEWVPENIANFFVNAFKRDPREGYASRFYQFLTDINDGKQFLEQIKPYSDKSGAAMRAGPIGLLADEKQVVEYATIQAKVTHDTPGGINSSVAAALMVHYCQYQLGDKQDLGNYLKSKVPGDWNTPWQGKVGHLGVDATHAAVAAIVSNQDLSAILKQCVDYTGDVDTVATIALAAASCSQGVNQDLPEELYSRLENSQFGLKYLQKLDQKLSIAMGIG